MNHKGRLWKPALAAVAVGAGVWGLASLAGISLWGTGDSPLELNSQQTAGKSSGHPEIEPGYVMVGGVKRPASDLAVSRQKIDNEKVRPTPSMADYGRTPETRADLNPHTKSVAEAFAKDAPKPERLGALLTPKPFDPAAYKQNPEAYLTVIEPGRVFAPAQPGPDVQRIQPLSKSRLVIDQGASVELAVSATPGAPVTFTSFDLGAFENGLTSITLAADKNGLAKVQFTGTSGTLGGVHILAASPVTSGQVRYDVQVISPQASPK